MQPVQDQTNESDENRIKCQKTDITDGLMWVKLQQLFFFFGVRNSFVVLKFHLREVWTTLH